MANRLTKKADVTYVPAVPYQPAVPGYCVMVPYTIPGYMKPGEPVVVSSGTDGSGNWSLTMTPSKYVPPKTAYRKVCYPAVPERQGVPASSSYRSIDGWNAGARSQGALAHDGVMQFQVNGGPAGVVIGLSPGDSTTLPSEQTHALYIHGAQIDVMESGRLVTTAPVVHAESNQYKITRAGNRVIYSTTGWSYTSDALSLGLVYLDASLYASIDYVDNPSITPTTPSGHGEVVLGAMAASGYGGDHSDGLVQLRALSVDGSGYQPVEGRAVLGGLQVVGSDREGYTWGEVRLAPLSIEADAYPHASIVSGFCALAPLAVVGIGYTGSVGDGGVTLGPLSTIGAETTYAEGAVSLQAFEVYGDAGDGIPDHQVEVEVLALGDFYHGVNNPCARIYDGLTLGDSYAHLLRITGAIHDALVLGDQLNVTQFVSAMIMEELRLGNSLSSLVGEAAQPLQYAVNSLTGALSTYRNFGFTGFASTSFDTYACKADGLYRLREGDDQGAGITVELDLGADNFGTPHTKTVVGLALAVTTDGEAYAKLRADNGEEYTYRLEARGTHLRQDTARGVSGRRWGLKLQFINATQFELEQVEQRLAVSSRRWTR